MAKNEVKVTVNVDDNGTIQLTEKSAKKLNATLGQVGEGSRTADRNIKGVAQTSSNASKNFSKMSQGMGGLVGAYAAFAAQVFALSAAFNFLKSAGDLSALQAGQEAQTLSTGIAMRTLTNDIIAATDAQIQFRDASQAAAIGTAAGLSQTQLVSLGKAAKDTSLVLGRDLTDSFNRLIRGVTKAEPELLDELGIILRLEDAAENYGRKIGKLGKDLTTFERQQAVANEVLTQAEEKYSRILEITDPAANAFNQFGKAFDDLVNTIRDAASTILTPLAKLASFNPFAALLIAAPMLVSAFKAIVPGAEEMVTKVTGGLDKLSARVTAFSKKTKGELAAIKFMEGDPTAARDLQKQAASDLLQLEKQQKTGFRGAQTLAKGSNVSLRTLVSNIKAAEAGTGAFAGMTQKLRTQYIAAFRDMQAATLTLGSTVTSTMQKSKLSVTGLVTSFKSGALKVAGAITTGIGAAISFLPKLFGRIFPLLGALLLGFELLPDSIKNFFKETLGFKDLSDDVQRLVDRTDSLNEEFKDFAKVQRILGEDMQGNFAATLSTLKAIAEFDLSQTAAESSAMFDELQKKIEEAEQQSTKLAEALQLFSPFGAAFDFLTGTTWAQQFNSTIAGVYTNWATGLKDIEQVTKDRIDQTIEALNLLPTSSSSTGQRYKKALEEFKNASTSNFDVVKKEVIEAERQFEEFGNSIKELEQSLKSLPKEIDSAFRTLLPAGRFATIIAGLEGPDAQIFNVDKDGVVTLTKIGEELKKSLDFSKKQNIELALQLARQAEILKILRAQRDFEAGMAAVDLRRQRANVEAQTGLTKNQLENIKVEQERDALGIQILKSREQEALTLQAIAANGKGLSEEDMNSLVINREKQALLQAQLDLLTKQQGAAYQMGQALKNGLEQGLEANIYDLITGQESSVKDAILKIGRSALQGLAKQLSRNITDSIMGLFGQKTEEQKAEEARKKLLQTYKDGGEAVRLKIKEAFDDAAAAFAPGGLAQTDRAKLLLEGESGPAPTAATNAVPDGTLARPLHVKIVETVKTAIGAVQEAGEDAFNVKTRGQRKAEAINEQNQANNAPGAFQANDPAFTTEAKLGGVKSQAALLGAPDGTDTDPISVKVTDAATGGVAGGDAGALISGQTGSGGRNKQNRQDKKQDQVLEKGDASASTMLDASKDNKAAAKDFLKAGADSKFASAQSKLASGDFVGAGIDMVFAAAQQMIAAMMQTTASAVPLAMGGVVSNGKKRASYSPGGIASGPKSGYPVTLHGTEAVVPLPDGKTIPVEVSGAVGSGTSVNNVSVNIAVDGSKTSQTQGGQSEQERMQKMGQMVAMAVQEELQRQKRPGGILSPYGAA